MKFFALATLTIVAVTIAGCGKTTDKTSIDTTASTAQTAIADKPTTWRYSSLPDASNGKVTQMATLPGGSPKEWNAEIVLGRDSGSMSSDVAMLNATGSPFLLDDRWEDLMVTFDNDSAQDFHGVEQVKTGGSGLRESKGYFIYPTDKFINRLKASKNATIALRIQGKGIQTVPFNTEGLKW